MSLAALLLALLPVLAPPQAGVRGVELHFQGNESVSPAALRRAAAAELADLERRGYRRAEVDDAAFAMEAHYRSQGFPFARVRYRYEIRAEVLHATFLVQEGPRCRLLAIEAEGVTAFPPDTVEALFRPEGDDSLYVATHVAGAAARLAALYRAAGYAEVEVAAPEVRFTPDRSGARVHLQVREGTRFQVVRVEVAGAAEALSDEVVAGIRRDFLEQPWTPHQAVELRLRLVEALRERGHADARGEVAVTADPESGDVALVARLEPGPKVRVAAVTVTGNARTSAAFIRSRLTLRPGAPWTLSAERESFRRLFRTALFRRVRLSLKGSGPERTLEVQVEEAPARDLEIAPGWGSYEQARLELAFRDRNLLGSGRTLRLETSASMVGWEALAGLTDPWLLGRELELDLPVFWRRRREPSFTGEEYGLALQLRRPLSRHLALTGAWRLRRSAVRAASASGITEVSLADALLASLSLEPRWDSRNDLFNPTGGALAFLRGELASSLLGSQLEYLRLRLEVSSYQALDESEDTVLALAVKAGVVAPTGDTEAIPIQERFFVGGQDTVRGFEEGELGPLNLNGLPVGGRSFGILNLELRRRLLGNLHGAAFLDAGRVGLGTGGWLREWRATPGLGLRYLLPVGAVRLDLGFNPQRRPGEEPWVLHLAVGMAF